MEEHRPKKLLDPVRSAIRIKHSSDRTEKAHIGEIKYRTYVHDVLRPSETVS